MGQVIVFHWEERERANKEPWRLSKLRLGTKIEGFESRFIKMEQGEVWRFGFQKELTD